MKYTGMIGLIVSTTAIGLLLSDNSKSRVRVCRELSVLCDMLSLDIGFRSTPITELLPSLLENESLRHLSFIGKENIISKLFINSCLNSEENAELSQFLFALGKSDTKSQLDLISGFKQYINKAENKYNEHHIKDSKLYVTFGFFGGVVISLMFI